MNWSSTDGKSWSITIGENQATVWLINEVSYLAAILWIDGSSTVLEGFGCIKEAKKACLELIERTTALDLELNKPVILRGEMYKAEHIEYHETVKDASMSAYWAIIDNTFMPCQIEYEGKIVWKNGLLTNDEYPTLVSLAEMEEES